MNDRHLQDGNPDGLPNRIGPDFEDLPFIEAFDRRTGETISEERKIEWADVELQKMGVYRRSASGAKILDSRGDFIVEVWDFPVGIRRVKEKKT